MSDNKTENFNELLKLRDLNNPDLIKTFKTKQYFILYDKLFIPYRKIRNENEQNLIDSNITSDNMIVRKPSNEKNVTPFSFNYEDFCKFAKDYNVDIFYSVDDNRFCIPTEIGLKNLNVSKLRKYYAQELVSFTKINESFITQLKTQQLKTDIIKTELRSALINSAEELVEIEFNRDNFNILFPQGIIQTPIEAVKLGKNQFDKLKNKHREKYLDLVYKTLHNPSIIINEFRLNNGNEELSHNYIKSYKDDSVIEGFQSIIVTIDNKSISVSSHNRSLDVLLNKIKTPEQLNFINPEVGHLIEQHTLITEQGMVNPTRSLFLAIESAYSTDITRASNLNYNKNLDLSTHLLKEPSLSNVAITENSSEIYQEEDVTKIISKSLEMKDGKLTEKGWGEISKTLQVYSDKRYETARYLFVQNGKIIRHVAISVQNPNATISKPDENVTYLEKLKTFAQNTNSSVVFVHNHPSGYVEPSLADKDTTQYLHNFFGDLFAGHIILDHGKFGIYEPKNQKWQALIDNKIYEMEEGKKQFSIHGSQIGIKQITNEKDLSILANYAKKIDNQANWNRDDWIPAFYSTHHGIVQSLEYIQNDDLKVENYQGLTNQIKYVGRDVGCNYIYLVPKTLEQKMLCEAFAQKTRIIQDIYFEKEDGTYELSNYSGGDIFSSLTKEEIKMDDSINYEITTEETNNTKEDIKMKTTDSVKTVETPEEYRLWLEATTDMTAEQIKFSVDAYEKEYFSKKHETNLADEYDKHVEQMQVNGGLSEVAIEAEINAHEKEENFELEEQEEIVTVFNDTNGNPHYVQEIVSILENFYKLEEQRWNIPEEQKTIVSHLLKFAEMEKGDFENSVVKLREYMDTKEFEQEERNYAEIFTPILMTSLGQDFDEETHTFTSEKFSYKFSTDELLQKKDISTFDKELIDYKNGILGDSHIFNLGKPSEILQKCGFPPHNRIELSSSRLKLKSEQSNHPFDIEDIIGLDKALETPIAVFEYGDKNKSQNVIVNLEKNGKNFLVGVFFNQKQRGYEVSDIRGLFNRDNIDWIRWIEQGKLIYGNKEKIQVSIAQQRTNLAEVNNQDARTSSDTYYLDSTTSILLKFGDVNDIFTEDFEFYKEQKERNEVFKKFRNYYAQNDSVEFDDAKFQSDEFYDALENKNITILKRYTSFDDNYEISNLAREILSDKLGIAEIKSPEELEIYLNQFCISSSDILTQKINGSDVILHFSKEEMQKILNEGKKIQNLNQNIQYLKTPDGELYGFVYNNEIYVDENLVNSNVLAHEYTHVWDNYVQKNNPELWDKGMVALKNTSLWQEVVNDKNYAELTTDSEILSECHARIVGKMAEKVLNRIAEIDGELIKDKIIDWDKEVSEYIATELLIKPELREENYISESVKAEYLKEFLTMPMKDLMNEVKLHFEQEYKIENPQKELNESVNNEIPIMPNVSDLQHSESKEVQTLLNELNAIKAAMKQMQSQFEHVSKENSSLRQENELLKGKINNINANQSIKETGEESLYREETKDTGTEINFNRNTAFNINCPIPPFGHEKEDGSIEIIENAHFAKHLLNKYDSASNKVVLTYADETGKHHEVEMHEREYRKMISACEEFAEKKNGVGESSYEWYLLHEKQAKMMKTDQNILRLNFASNFIHNYRIMCKLYASNQGEAVKQAQKLVDMMHPNERRTFNKWRKQVGEKTFDNLLLKEFQDHVQGIENKNSLILNNNELLYDVNKRHLEFQKDEEIVLTKNDKVIKNSGKKIGDTIKMAFKYESFGGKKLKAPMLEYQIVKVTKNQSPDTVLLYNAEQKITQTIPLKDFMKHIRKIEKQQLKENAEQIKKDYKIYGYEGR